MSTSLPADPDTTKLQPPEEIATRTLPQQIPSDATRPTQVAPAELPPNIVRLQVWQLTHTIGDFELIAKLGEGALGIVYLAKQISLNRHVALKVTDAATAGTSEGMALAGLEHEHIVKVYSSFVEPTTAKHCLCLQYVPGTNLAAVIQKVHKNPPRTGQDILDAIDTLATSESRFDPTALQNRDALAKADFYSAVCLLGEQLCSALSFAHSRDILHCDIKPGNILVTHYGRPMLVDFNISVKCAPDGVQSAVGGTPKYMSPEQTAAFLDDPHENIDHRTDLYSLGVVLYELATGVRPASDSSRKFDELPRELRAVIQRCLEDNPKERYADAAEMGAALAGVRAIITTRRQLPKPSRLGRWAIRRPISVMLILALIPHLIATVLNIAYNKVQIDLTTEQHTVFSRMILVYNIGIYSVCLAVAAHMLLRLHRNRMLAICGELAPDALDTTRKQAVRLTHCGVMFALVGWGPGAILFPLVIHLFAGPLPWQAFVHFAISFALAGLVGMVYSYFGILYVILRSLYPQLCHADGFSFSGAQSEIRKGTQCLGFFLILATLIPLTGAVLLICLADSAMTLGFRLLVTSLIVLGMLGITGLMRVMDRLAALAAPWMNTGDEMNDRRSSWSAVWRKAN